MNHKSYTCLKSGLMKDIAETLQASVHKKALLFK